MSRALDCSDAKRVTVYHTPNFQVWTQGMLWHTINNRLQFIPATWYGLVCVVRDSVSVGKQRPKYGYLVYRPAALEITIPTDVAVTRCALSMEVMQAWYKVGSPWASIKPLRGIKR